MWSVLFGMTVLLNLYQFPCGKTYYLDGNDMDRCGDVDDSDCNNNNNNINGNVNNNIMITTSASTLIPRNITVFRRLIT